MESERPYGGRTREERRALRRTQIVEAARFLLSSEGISKVTVKGICNRAGLTERYFYESFTNRDALLDEVFQQIATEGVSRILLAVAVAPNDPRERIRAALTAALDTLIDEPQLGKTVSAVSKDQALMRQKTALVRLIGDLLGNNLPLLLGDHGLAEPQVRMVTTFLAAGGIEVFSRWLDGTLEMSREALINQSADMLIGVVTGILGLRLEGAT